jgi:hypothetical protein
MAKQRPVQGSGFVVASDEPLIGVLVEEQGQESVRYFTDEAAADAALPKTATEDALSAIGAFADLDWAEMEDALDRIRHVSKPTAR